MDSEIVEEVRVRIRSAAYVDELQHLEEVICDTFELTGAEAEAARRIIHDEQVAFLAEQKSWPARTDCDRLDEVFGALNKQGIVALQNAGYTQSDGYHDVMEAYENQLDKQSIRGYCFFHEQDLDRAIRYGKLFLAFGPIDPSQEETEGPVVGRMIAVELAKQGFSVAWDGTFNQRIGIEPFDWKKRTHGSTPVPSASRSLIARLLGVFARK